MTPGIAVPDLIPLEDSVAAFCRDPHGFLLSQARPGGAPGRFRLGDESLAVLHDPESIHAVLNGSLEDFERGELYDIPRTMFGNGLFTSDGQAWADQRALLAPLFSKPRMQRVGSRIATLVGRQLDAWSEAPEGEEIDVLPATRRLAFDVVTGEGLLGIDDPVLAGELFQAVVQIDRTESVTLRYLSRRMGSGQSLGSGFSRSQVYLAIDRYYELTYAAADERLARAAQPDDLLGAVVSSPTFAALPAERRRDFVRDLIATMIAAGYVTTGESMFWALHLLARNPEAQARARAELESASPPADGHDGHDGASAAGHAHPDPSPYLAAVLNESLRLYPSVWFMGRIARRTVVVGGAEFPAGTRVICSPWVLHRMAEYWPEPEAFRPERFLGGGRGIVARSFIPFGGGMRACVGRVLAMMELAAMVSGTLRRFNISTSAVGAPKLSGAYSLHPRERVLLQLNKRA